jgi:putative membrane protein
MVQFFHGTGNNLKKIKMKKVILTICLLAGALNFTSQNNSTNKIDSKDLEFAKDAAQGGLLEVKLGELAVSKATSKEVKDLAQHMITDHSKANEELKALAEKKDIALPTEMSKDGKDIYEKLSKKSVEDFDKAYTEQMVKDHEKDIDKFAKEAEKGKDEDLKNWATKTLPTLKHHLLMSKEIKNKVAKK